MNANIKNQSETDLDTNNGCLFYGCLSVIIIAVLLFVGSIFGYYHLKSQLIAKITPLLSSEPLTVAVQTLSPAEYSNLKGEYDKQVRALEANKSASFKLSATDINTLIAQHNFFEGVKDRAFVTMSGDAMKVDFSIPIIDKYLNGFVVIKFKPLDDGTPAMKITDLHFNQGEVPDDINIALNSFFATYIPLSQKHKEEGSVYVEKFTIENGILLAEFAEANSQEQTDK
jgi:hypothetical protein